MPDINPGKLAATERNASQTHLRGASLTGQIHQAVTSPPVFYTDGSISRRHRIGHNIGWMTGWGYLCLDGRYGCGKYPQFHSKGGHDQTIPVVTELRAVWHAIGHQLATGPAVVITDSAESAGVLNRWKTGSTTLPAGYRGSDRKVPTLERLRLVVAANPDRLTVQAVKGHNGDVLNEAADTLAQLGMRWARDHLTKDDVTRRAAGIAEGFLADYRRRR